MNSKDQSEEENLTKVKCDVKDLKTVEGKSEQELLANVKSDSSLHVNHDIKEGNSSQELTQGLPKYQR